MSSQVGTLLSGRYRLDAQVGAGGMSTVYRAFDTRARAPGRDQADAPRDRLGLRPARALPARGARGRPAQPPARRRRHRRRRGRRARPYIVFEYVEGETLKDRIRRHGPPAGPRGVAYAIEIARALGAAHEHRIVHRDVKPQNVLIDEEGTAKVTDFGIARSLTEEGLTADGRVLGTTDYVSPEQALGQTVGPQSRPLLAGHRALRDAHRRRARSTARTRSRWR